jgi:menaquinone-specific isochorismate synthase
MPSRPRFAADRRRLREAVLEAVESAPSSPGGLVRVEVPASASDPLRWIAAVPAGSRTYWRSRRGHLAIAGTGVAAQAQCTDVRDLAPFVEALPAGGTAFVTGRFAGGRPSDEWAPFGSIQALLPRIERRQDADGGTLALYFSEAERADADTVVEPLLRALAPPASTGDGEQGLGLPHVVRRGALSRVDTPERGRWEEAVRWALRRFDDGVLEKAVLARRSTWSLPTPVDPVAALDGAVESAPACYHVVVERGNAAFLSFSPERLFVMSGRRVVTEAVAGTIPGNVPEPGFGEKELREHDLVVRDICERLAPLVDELATDEEAGVMRLAHRRHLHRRIAGTARPGVTALDVLAALHPTPAVGGRPRDEALRFIADAEGFDRGLYGGFVGRIGRDADGTQTAEFAVGIRSALVTPDAVHLYAGAGIVPGSDPRAEWDEIDGKMGDVAQALGLQ